MVVLLSTSASAGDPDGVVITDASSTASDRLAGLAGVTIAFL